MVLSGWSIGWGEISGLANDMPFKQNHTLENLSAKTKLEGTVMNGSGTKPLRGAIPLLVDLTGARKVADGGAMALNFPTCSTKSNGSPKVRSILIAQATCPWALERSKKKCWPAESLSTATIMMLMA